MDFAKVICVVFACFIIFVECKKQKKTSVTYDKLFDEGVHAYDDSNWYQCAIFFENALKDYNLYRKTVIDCRIVCKHKTKNNSTIDGFSDVMKNILVMTECIRTCKMKVLGSRDAGRSTEVIEEAFRNRKPYEYLQYCYYKLDRLLDAASAAYTFYIVNSDSKDAIRNIDFYRDKVKIQDTEFIDLELRPYKEHYIRAMMAYEDQLWEEVVDEMEKALEDYYREEERCRSECEGPLLTSPPLEFYSYMSEHYVNVIQCQYKCEYRLSEVFPEEMTDLLAEHYHYLQFAYYKLSQVDKASEAAATFLYIKPEDEVMLKNKEFFVNQGYSDTHTPRPEVVKYVNRRKELKTLIVFAAENLVTSDYMEFESDHEDFEPVSKPTAHWMKRYEDMGLKIIANGNHLNGSKRFASDGFLKEEQCTELKYMIEDYYTNENGSRIITIKDMFDKFGENEEELEVALRLLLRSSEISRHYMKKYHNLTELYFKRTVITCWEITKESQYNRTCLPQEDGSCLEDISQLPDKKDYMSLMFLNNIVKGADLNFLNPNKTVSRNVSSQCGRLVGLTTNEYHNVTVPTDEMRCTVVIKYTINKKEEEKDYIQTQIALQLFEDEKIILAEKSNIEVMKELKNNGTVVSMSGDELCDNIAFVADGLSTNEECSTLQNLVTKQAIDGDGYDYLQDKPSVISPHTEYETFIGLTVLRAASLVYHRKVSAKEVSLFLDLAEKGRFMVEKYFNLTRPLYFDFTHLVCRTAIEGENQREDLSHPVHADNCILQPDGTCLKSFPAFTQRDYSAILYLNDKFEGGEFFFAHSNKSEKVSVKPKCGRLVAFDAKEFHGVKAVRKGQRCALALWFTLNPNYKELAHVQARKIISKMAEIDANNKQTGSKSEFDHNDIKSENKEDDIEKSDSLSDLNAKKNDSNEGDNDSMSESHSKSIERDIITSDSKSEEIASGTILETDPNTEHVVSDLQDESDSVVSRLSDSELSEDINFDQISLTHDSSVDATVDLSADPSVDLSADPSVDLSADPSVDLSDDASVDSLENKSDEELQNFDSEHTLNDVPRVMDHAASDKDIHGLNIKPKIDIGIKVIKSKNTLDYSDSESLEDEKSSAISEDNVYKLGDEL